MPSQTNDAFFSQEIKPKCLSPTKFTCYYGTFVHTPTLGKLEVFHNCAVGVDPEGTIQFIEDECDDPLEFTLQFTGSKSSAEIEIVDISDSDRKFFFPGFIDTHIHAPQFPNNGIFGDSTLLEWLEIYTFPLESSFESLTVAKEIYSKCIQRTLSSGTTTASYYATIHTNASKLLADLALKMGQRAFIGKVCMNQNSPDNYIETFEECKSSQMEVLKHLENRDPKAEFVAPVITPRFAGSCTDELLKWLGQLRKSKDYHCQTHLDENHKEIEWITGLFPQYKNYTDIYKQTNLLGHKTTLAHCIHLLDEEKDMLSDGCWTMVLVLV
ncbi:unnamed protein product [Ambrosiozyma monospora]|uniref:Unnamed protein product n=1 Tax=Ambrosiozyma monospora TaxID=43982 RepID=A0ACB5U0R9_AMBMO|nr:unnamed protein product [Ambrosiozyma monospora]